MVQLQGIKARTGGRGGAGDYLNVIKPRETSLLVFIGVISALAAGSGPVSPERFFFILMALLAASAGANGLTNYLDREIDARMERTRRRALPAGRIYPPERALFFSSALSILGLVMAWYLHPSAFLADLAGTAAAVIWRKRVTCVFPQGILASCAPVLMGWLAVNPGFSRTLVWLCVLIAVWLPSHIWSVMIARREEYIQAGITYFPVSCSVRTVSRILPVLSILLLGASLGLYFAGGFGYLYLAVACLLGTAVVLASFRLMISGMSGDAWKLYKISAFPYLGLIFLAIYLDIRLPL